MPLRVQAFKGKICKGAHLRNSSKNSPFSVVRLLVNYPICYSHYSVKIGTNYN